MFSLTCSLLSSITDADNTAVPIAANASPSSTLLSSDTLKSYIRKIISIIECKARGGQSNIKLLLFCQIVCKGVKTINPSLSIEDA